MEIAVGLSIGGCGLLAAGIALAALGRSRRFSRALGERVVREVEPYLRRKAAEVGIETSAPVWTSRHTPSDRLDYSAGLAVQLLNHERQTPLEASSTALAQTLPSSGETNIDETAPQSPKARKPE